MKLSNITIVESIPEGNIYRADCSEDVKPGQYLKANNKTISIIKSDSLANTTQIIFQSTESIADEIEFSLVGEPIEWSIDKTVTVICSGIGNLVAVHWLNQYRKQLRDNIHSVVLYEPESFSFKPSPSQIMTPEYPSNMIASMPLLDDLGFSSRLVCEQFRPGCFEGSLSELIQEMPIKPTYWIGFADQATVKEIGDLIGEPVNAYLTDKH